tara:strand:- start:176 stop:910 length:735 start_codon:yes stop_codon:yes gene_type:complete
MIIAEVGLNHMGDSLKLKKIVNELCKTEIDGITLQVREQSFYRKGNWKNFLLKDNVYKEIAMYVKNKGKIFGMALSDIDKIEFFSKFSDFFKILSKDIKNEKILKAFNETKKTCFLSTGNSDNEEINNAINILDNCKLIHTRLDNSVNNVNLKAILSMKRHFLKPIAFGNHCEHHEVLFSAVTFQPSDYFFYVKDISDNTLPPDNLHAIEIKNVNYFSKKIKLLKNAIGDGKKQKTKNSIKGQI